ncbi:hypothetical protein BC833DRAFT_56525 [Globomyces pollinis-pini]|nr:hypothetical protein BC833DRAFT_56525 [Globomyces pollinis-pini]
MSCFQFLFTFLLIPSFLDLIRAFFLYQTVRSSVSNSEDTGFFDKVSFGLVRCIGVEVMMMAYLAWGGFNNARQVDMAYLKSPFPSPNVYDVKLMNRHSEVPNIAFGLAGMITSVLFLGKYILPKRVLSKKVSSKNTASVAQSAIVQ